MKKASERLAHEKYCLNSLKIMHEKDLESAKALVKQKIDKIAELQKEMDYLDSQIKKLED